MSKVFNCQVNRSAKAGAARQAHVVHSYMGTAAGFDIALVIAKASSSKATDQQVERLGHGSSLDENVT